MQPEWLAGVQKVGVTAGRSTPDWVLEDVLKKLQEQGGTVRR